MAVLGVMMIGGGVYLLYYAWESHKTNTAPTPITHAQDTLKSLGSGVAGTGAQSVTSSGNPLPATRVSAQ